MIPTQYGHVTSLLLCEIETSQNWSEGGIVLCVAVQLCPEQLTAMVLCFNLVLKRAIFNQKIYKVV